MIGDLFAIFRARRDPALAARLAAKFAGNQVLDRITAPLFIVQLLSWVAVVVCALLVIGALVAAVTLHWTAALPAVIPLGIGILAFKVQHGLGRGLDAVRGRAEALTDQGMDRILPPRPDVSPSP